MDSIMNKTALYEITGACSEYLDSLTGESTGWRTGFAAAIQRVEQVGMPIAEACDADYGDAGGPVMNQEAQTAITVDLDGMYNDNAATGNHNGLWLLGVAAGMQRFEMYAGDIVADCT